MADRDQALKEALKSIEKQYGKGSVMVMGDDKVEALDVISSGSLVLDDALGVGGYPKGRIIEIYGPESSGKTTFALHAIAEAQKAGGYAAFIDAEHALDPKYAKALGVDIENLVLSQPDSGEQALEIAEALIKSGAIDIIVIDSVAVAALVGIILNAVLPGKDFDMEKGFASGKRAQADADKVELPE